MLSSSLLNTVQEYLRMKDKGSGNKDEHSIKSLQDLLNLQHTIKVKKVQTIANYTQLVFSKDLKGWNNVFRGNKDSFLNLDEILSDDLKNNNIYPSLDKTFRVFEMIKPEEVRVIIVGHDPYPGVDDVGHPYANGIPLSINKYLDLTPSLRNINSELSNYGHSLEHGDLSGWVSQGIFMINRSLTVRKSKTGSHTGYWDWLVLDCINHIVEVRKRLGLFLPIIAFWGAKSRELAGSIKNVEILTAPHPSAFGDTRFSGCGHFSKIDKYLLENGSSVISWSTFLDE